MDLPTFSRDQFQGLTFHQRIVKVAYNYARLGFKLKAISLPPEQYSGLEYVQPPFLSVSSDGLCLLVLSFPVRIQPYFHTEREASFSFASAANGHKMDVCIDLDPPKADEILAVVDP